jgi:RHS repeat-associated protein
MPTDYNFAGQRLDTQTGLLYDNARYYDPVSGRFISSDTVQNNTKGMDSYAYVGDNPVVRTDPSGKCWPLCTMLIGAAIGAVVWVATTVVTGAITGKMPSGGQIAQAAVTGAVAGAITGLAGPEAGPLARIAAGAVANAMQGKPIMDGVGQAAISGAITGGVMEGAGALAGKIGGDVEDGASSVLEDVGCSFTPATPVTTDHGWQSIGTLKVGEKVLAYNPKTKKMELQPILHVWITQDNDLVNLTITTHSGHGNAAKSTSEVIHTNKKHPFLTVEKGFLPVGQIKLGMHVVEADGQVGVITGWVLVPGVMTMYNLEVAHDHTFTVGSAQWIVHNTCDPETLRELGTSTDNACTNLDLGPRMTNVNKATPNVAAADLTYEGPNGSVSASSIFISGEVGHAEAQAVQWGADTLSNAQTEMGPGGSASFID